VGVLRRWWWGIFVVEEGGWWAPGEAIDPTMAVVNLFFCRVTVFLSFFSFSFSLFFLLFFFFFFT
jgi:hypothetical protein